jgi:N-methylhydantoinase A
LSAIANNNMVNAIKLISVNRGMTRDFTLIAFGGGGGCTRLARRKLGSRRLVVPSNQGLSAWGMLLSDLRRLSCRRRSSDDGPKHRPDRRALRLERRRCKYVPNIDQRVHLRYGGAATKIRSTRGNRPAAGPDYPRARWAILETFPRNYEREYTYRLTRFGGAGWYHLSPSPRGQGDRRSGQVTGREVEEAIKAQVDYVEPVSSGHTYNGDILNQG